MAKNIIYLTVLLLLATGVIAINYDWIYNPYLGGLDSTLSLDQTGNNLTANFISVNGSWISDVCFTNGTSCAFATAGNTSEDFLRVTENAIRGNASNVTSYFVYNNGTIVTKINTNILNLSNYIVNQNTTLVNAYTELINSTNSTLERYITAMDLANNNSLFDWNNYTNATQWYYIDSRDIYFNTSMYDYVERIKYNRSGGIITGNVTINANLTVNGFMWGQPLDGYLGSGVIYSSAIDSTGNVNITHSTGRSLTYPNLIVRLATSSGVVKYCNISSGSIVVTDEQHSIVYVDNSCNVQEASVQTYINTDLSPGGIADIFQAMAHSNDVEVHIGAPIQNKIGIKERKNHLKTDHLNVVSGMEITTEAFPNYTQSEGEYIFIVDVVNASEQNTSVTGIEYLSRVGGAWTYTDQAVGINLTWCDDGTDTNRCTNTNLYRRYLLCTTGYSNGDDETEIHQLASQGSTYANIGSCLDVVNNPITYTLPTHYEYVCTVNYVYCGRPLDTTWSGSFIDLRETKSLTSSADIDTSIFLTRDGNRNLTGHWNQGVFNLTNIKSYFLGIVNLSRAIGFITESQITDYGANSSADFEPYFSQDLDGNSTSEFSLYINNTIGLYNTSVIEHINASNTTLTYFMFNYISTNNVSQNTYFLDKISNLSTYTRTWNTSMAEFAKQFSNSTQQFSSYINSTIIIYNASIKAYIDAQDSAQDECSEITGCVELAVTNNSEVIFTNVSITNSLNLHNNNISNVGNMSFNPTKTHYMEDNDTCIIIRGSTSTMLIC